MESLVWACSFAAAAVVSACVVLLFSKSIDQAFARASPGDGAPEWCRYVKFALFTLTFAMGEIAQFVKFRMPSEWPPDLVKTIVKTSMGSLIAASALLLAVFGAALAAYASARVQRPSGPAAGPERHSHVKDRPRTEEQERLT